MMPVVQPTQDIRDQIDALLNDIEQERGVRVLFAIESGSRAWGFASPDSDYDIRFLFAQPIEAYLSLRPKPDAFDLMDGDLDAGGWDIRKAAELMSRSNAPLLEWIDSPIVYREIPGTRDRLRALRARYFDAKKTCHHYLSMARGVWKNKLADVEQPRRKAYLYALRPLACIRYIELHGVVPSTEFDRVLESIDWPDDVRCAVASLVADKLVTREIGTSDPDPTLHAFIPQALSDAESSAERAKPNDVDYDALDRFVFDVILSR